MKTGAEIHFLAGQLFTIGLAAIVVLPRMPFDEVGTIGGRLSFPFRRALLMLVIIGLIRVMSCHIRPITASWMLILDGVLGTIHVVGQSFLCLTTAYLLQCQLVDYINIEGGRPGRSLVPYLVVISVLAIVGAVVSPLSQSNLWSFVNLAEAISVWPVVKTLKTYTMVTSGGAGGRGPILTQMLAITEYWYLTTSILAFLAETCLQQDDDLYEDSLLSFPVLVMQAIRLNQDNGIDDWTRLLMHAVFLNQLDELQHIHSTAASSNSTNSEGARDEAARPSVKSDRLVIRNRDPKRSHV